MKPDYAGVSDTELTVLMRHWCDPNRWFTANTGEHIWETHLVALCEEFLSRKKVALNR
jgi:hypothetical protein